MMDLDEYSNMLESQQVPIVTTSDSLLTNTATLFHDMFIFHPSAPPNPTTAVAPTKSTIGAINKDINNSSGSNMLLCTGGTIYFRHAENTDYDYSGYLLIDRLSHQGDLVTSTTLTQTTNLPTAALTRYTDGVGVMIGLSIYVNAASNYSTTATISYTNQAGTSGRSSVATFPIDNGSRARGTFYLFPLQQGDTGVRSVQSVTLAASRSSIPRFGVVLFKPLAFIGGRNFINFGQCNFIDGHMIGGIPEIIDDACLSVLAKVSYGGVVPSAGAKCAYYFYETDNVPDPVNWSNITWYNATGYGTITSKQITGIVNPITLKVIDAVTSPDIQLWVQVSNSEITGDQLTIPAGPTWTQIADSPGTTFSVSNNQWVSFCCYGTSVISAQTVSVLNADKSDAVVDTFTIQVDK